MESVLRHVDYSSKGNVWISAWAELDWNGWV